MIHAALDQALYAFVTLIALVNPISAAAVFVTVTEGRTPADQAQIARRASIVALIALIAFAFAGEALLNALSVEVGAFKIAGGLLLLKVAFNMVFAQASDRQNVERTPRSGHAAIDPSVFPLAIPMITGPGALTASVTLINPEPGHQILNEVIFVVIALVVIGITYLFMRAAETLTKWFGETGIDAISRIVGIIVAAIAVQLVVNGVSSLTSLKFH
ncbi:MAG TPA: MarC family protein [Candidatus Cybelea sp.]|jgi:multiple antibiotic resistance protein|nr:MarC family protein [Candidatus Cybelea sp.]